MKKYKKIVFIILAPILVFALYKLINGNKSVSAEGNLAIAHNNVPIQGNPVFFADDMKPCDVITETIIVKNNDEISRFIAVKGEKIDETKNFSTTLFIEITKDGDVLYGGGKSLDDFFNDSVTENGIPLTVVEPGESATYLFTISFPCEAGNEFQKATLQFELSFGIVTSENLVINEVYYNVDESHGIDSCCGGNINSVISGNGAFSNNLINIQINNVCIVAQSNISNIINNIIAKSNSGKNSPLNGIITTGNTATNVSLLNLLNFNFGSCSSMNARNDEWVEIFNPSDSQISLKNWKLVDASGTESVIHSNTVLYPGEFALIAKDAQTWTYWNEPASAKKVQLGGLIGSGLDNDSDHLILVDPGGVQRDFVAWGGDTDVWDPAIPNADKGNSIERLTPGFDTDSPTDWEERDPPTPGN